MRKIIITESQLHRLAETLLDGGNGNIKEFPGSEVSATSNVSDTNGKPKFGKPKTTDKVQDDITNQNIWIHNQRPVNAR